MTPWGSGFVVGAVLGLLSGAVLLALACWMVAAGERP